MGEKEDYKTEEDPSKMIGKTKTKFFFIIFFYFISLIINSFIFSNLFITVFF